MPHYFFSVVWSSTKAEQTGEGWYHLQSFADFVIVAILPFVGVFDEQAGQQRLGVRGQRARELDVLHEYEFKQLLVVLVVEWQASTHHLVRHHTQTPPVHRPAVVIVLQDLWREMKNSQNKNSR